MGERLLALLYKSSDISGVTPPRMALLAPAIIITLLKLHLAQIDLRHLSKCN